MYWLSSIGRAAGALALVMLSGCGPSSTTSAYTFSTPTTEIAMDGEPTIDVRIVRASDNALVENAVVFETRFDMAPDSMGEMAAPVTAQGSPEPGLYRFMVKPTMAGRWELKLGVKVQGEADTVRGSVVVTAR